MATVAAGLSTGERGSTIYLGRWATRELAELAADRAALFLGLSWRPLRHPRRARRLGPASPEELRRLAREQAPSRSSRYAGVSYDPRQRGFYAYVDQRGERTVLGLFHDEVEAGVAVDRVRLHFGLEVVNFPERRLSPTSPDRIKAQRLRERKKATTSKYVGVVYVDGRLSRPWCFYLKGMDHHTAVGGFANEREAALAHDRAALRYCKRPLLNFPTEARALGAIDFETLRKEIRGERKKTTTSLYRGVSWQKRRRKWYATIHAHGVRHHLGVFDDEVDAAHAYDAAASRLLGDAVILNFPDVPSRERAQQNAVASSARTQRKLRSTREASKRTTRTP